MPAAADLGKSNDLLGNWDQSKAVKSGKECQTCHMPEQVGESANGEAKRKVANHTFPGRIGQLRQEAAKLEVTTKVDGDKTTVTVAVQSLVPHNLPTTHPGWASVVLELDIKGKNLKTVFNDKRVYGRTYADAKGQKTVFDFEAVKVLEETVLKAGRKTSGNLYLSHAQRHQDLRRRSHPQLCPGDRTCLFPAAH